MRRSVLILFGVALLAGGVFVYVRHSRHVSLIHRIDVAGRSGQPIAPPAGPIAYTIPDPVIVAENAKRGDPGWKLRPGAPRDIAGFADRTSVAAGEALTFFAETPQPRYGASVYRLGWYHGAGARLIARVPERASVPQPRCPITPVVKTISCARWRPGFRLTTGRAWVSGQYLVKLRASDGAESYVPFVVRERVPRAPILLQSSVTTWQAYNLWGGKSSYRGLVGTRHALVLERSRAVSFDRPYAWPGDGLLRWEFPLAYFLESRGYPVAYSTDVDLHEGLGAMNRRRVVISMGHDEFYSLRMRTAVEQAIASGTSFAFFGGNDMYRHIRLGPSPLGPDRIEVNYRFAVEDPLTKTDPKDATVQWRDPPNNMPEQAVLGAQYGRRCGTDGRDWYPTLQPPWLFEGTGFTLGSHVRDILGYEVDWVWNTVAHPTPETVVAASPIRCKVSPFATSTLYRARSNALVFDAGSLWFDCGLGPGCASMPRQVDTHLPMDPPGARSDARLQRMVENLLRAMLRGSG